MILQYSSLPLEIGIMKILILLYRLFFLLDDLPRKILSLGEDSSTSEWNSEFCIMCEGQNIKEDDFDRSKKDEDDRNIYQQCVSCYGFCHKNCNPPIIQACLNIF